MADRWHRRADSVLPPGQITLAFDRAYRAQVYRDLVRLDREASVQLLAAEGLAELERFLDQ